MVDLVATDAQAQAVFKQLAALIEQQQLYLQPRLAEVRRKLQLPGRTPILEIAFAAGFNSKSTFNSLFKASTGLTPRQYQRQQVQNPESGRI